ncbi:outer membrane protein [Sphingosinicella sp. BN140058]|uniref:outer membrane protein n=1 Tax=Sphingosinicella sp. BN140058 TaxID=1892855 RepID=UPI0013EB90CE|nr:outer membrane beta-barrel protein [Sphingosinicella sp. BN140058]
MTFRIMLAATAAALLTAAPAAAADFSGLRAEVTAGRAKDSVKADLDNGTTPFSRKQDDVSFGLEAGYDLDLGSAVVGPYVGVDFPNVDGCDSVFGSDEFCYKAKRNYALGARAGFKIGGPILAYGKVGYSSGRFKSVYTDVTDPDADRAGSDTQRGIHFGAGAEVAFASFYAKAEYLRTDYDEGDLGHDVARDQLKVGVGMRF